MLMFIFCFLQLLYFLQEQNKIEENSFYMKLIPLIGVITLLIQLLFYILIYSTIFTHDQLMVGEAIISKEVYKTRQQHNSFTLGTQIAWYTNPNELAAQLKM